MKILVLHQYFLGKDDPGGSRFNQFVKYWEEMGHEITVIAGTVHYATGEKEEKYKGKFVVKEEYSKNVNVLRTYVSESYNKSFLGRLWGYFSFSFSSLWAMLFHVKKHDVMIVTSPPLFVGITGILGKFFKRTPMVFEIRDLWPESAIDTGVLSNKLIIKIAYIVEKLSYRFADKINVLTPAFKQALITKKGIAEKKICFIPNGADLDIFEPGPRDNWVREEYNLQDKFVVTYMGAHGVANHLDSLIDVAKEFSEDENVMIVLIGDGMKKAELKQRVEVEKIRNVLFVDSQSKHTIPDFCNASDICTAVLKKVETFKTVYPNKVFDYMSCAKPILIGIDGVARDLVEESGSGYYVDPEDAKAFADKIRELQKDEELRSKLGESGYAFVQESFSREALASKYITELEKVVKR
ncbi:glycosyltransferase family 4 protein [Sporosarcina sp. Marseille-Q4063]|uniref:glycosyltransferase family 4 protein n=1 Tax=Sporosarcina sp. Marseille-Q4063 TaxID=2810514 RepID=UPI001BB0162F|nr:glycosyltransferase family 4 protein [Sporosarcina sp. Marseille-Q4063]QUW21252.1 glycosyltransferase family 4 protein [Sporosarcina sp. Marseille-Q4063]